MTTLPAPSVTVCFIFMGMLGVCVGQLFAPSLLFPEPEYPRERPKMPTTVIPTSTSRPPGMATPIFVIKGVSTTTEMTTTSAAPICPSRRRCRNKKCPFDFIIDINGCKTCKCKAGPCEGRDCGGEEEVCHIKSPPCSQDTCPQELICINAKSVCGSPPPKQDESCGITDIRFYHNPLNGKCEILIDTGCGSSNKNRFINKEECERICKVGDLELLLPACTHCPYGFVQRKVAGIELYTCDCIKEDPCESKRCSNRQKNTCRLGFSKCAEGYYCNPVATCVSGASATKECQLPLDMGERGEQCNANLQRYFYHQGSCQEFRYSGCRGNRNNFFSKEECLRICSPRTTTAQPPPTRPDPCDKPKYKCKDECFFGEKFVKESKTKCKKCQCKENPCKGYDCKKKGNEKDGKCYALKKCTKKKCNFSASCKNPKGVCAANLSKGSRNKNVKKSEMREGSCGPEERFFYNITSDHCMNFTFNSCKTGNANNFLTEKECQEVCLHSILWEAELKTIPKDLTKKCPSVCYTHCPYGHTTDTRTKCTKCSCQPTPCTTAVKRTCKTYCRTKPKIDCITWKASKPCSHEAVCIDKIGKAAGSVCLKNVTDLTKCSSSSTKYRRYRYDEDDKKCTEFSMCSSKFSVEGKTSNSFEIKEECENACKSAASRRRLLSFTPRSCGRTCYMLCLYGRKRDEEGCPVCKCKPNPCAPKKCDKGWKCMTRKDDTCSDDDECDRIPVCVKPARQCQFPMMKHKCHEPEARSVRPYFYNSTSETCERFKDAKCRSSHNNFYNKHECQQVCGN